MLLVTGTKTPTRDKTNKHPYKEAVKNMNTQINPLQWTEAVGRAQNYCSAIVKRGGSPKDAVRSYGLFRLENEPADWEKAEQIIALAMCKPTSRPN
jgi:hypothetical protein